MSTTLPRFRVEEKKHFHPIVRQWLIDGGKEFDYECKLPGYGRADFVVRDRMGDYAVEAKLKLSGSGNTAISQVKNYQHGLGKAFPCIVVPEGGASADAYLNADRLNVRVVELAFDVAKAVREDWLREIRSSLKVILMIDGERALPYCLEKFEGALCEYIEFYNIPRSEWLSFPYQEYRSVFALSHSVAESWAMACYNKLWWSELERVNQG